jgi:DNA-binding transcriptional ArsR family regulator
MKECIARYAPLMLILSLALITYHTLPPQVKATPRGLTLTSPAASIVQAEPRNETQIYILEVQVQPLSSLVNEKIACIYGARIQSINTTTGKITLENPGDAACIYITLDNPTIHKAVARLVVVAQAQPEERREPPLALVGAVACVAAATYLTQTEGGRDKLFKAASIPISYYVARHEDVLRSRKRVQILEYLKKEPGASMRRIARETGVSFGEVQWHLSILERLGYVRRVRIGKWHVYYPTGTATEKWLANFMAKELGERIIERDAQVLAEVLERYLSTGTVPIAVIKENIPLNARNTNHAKTTHA